MKKNTRWTVLYASMAILLCAGSLYSFSVFAKPLSVSKGWSLPDVMLAFTINAAIAPIPTIIGGFISDKGKANISIILGGILFAVGFILTGFATTKGMLYFSYGVLSGVGQAFAYSGIISNALRFFPDIVALFFIKVAPANYQPEGWVQPVAEIKKEAVNKNWKQMLMSLSFYFIISMFAIGAFSGLMVASNASVISQTMFGLTASVAATFVSIYALSNSLGRIVWGIISDKIGHEKTLIAIYSVIAISLLILVNIRTTLGLTVGLVLLGLCFGGTMGVFAPLVMKTFGPINQGVNYGIVFIGFSTAAFFAPKYAAGIAAKHNGDFTDAFYVAIALVIVGLVISVVYSIFSKRKTF